MKYRVIHETTYDFEGDVFFEPHILRFKPKSAPHISLESFNIQIRPTPTGLSESMDPENNFLHYCWFEGLHDTLDIRAEFLVDAKIYNPFDFIIYPNEFYKVPFHFTDQMLAILSPYIIIETLGSPLLEFGQKVLHESGTNTIAFLTALTGEIHQIFILEIREEGAPLAPDKTFELRRGSCRDLAWMQIQLLRQMGMAARFVSGYFYPAVQDPEFELHAWVEVFLPGAGWIGFDPSHGIVAGSTHIPIAASAQYENTMTVTGTVRGNASSALITKLNIDRID